MSKKKKHINIPVFIPELGCPNQCVFCNQRAITSQLSMPDKAEIHHIIQQHLETASKDAEIEIAYFGGNFTGLTMQQQQYYLEIAQPYLKAGLISGIRLSTRPDYINEEKLNFLKLYHVQTIELGVQSMIDEVLLKAGRGHTAADAITAAGLIKSKGFQLGMQMMIGLPGDTLEHSIFTAQQIVKCKADNTRIYPVLVIKNTMLEKLYVQNKYMPLSINDTVQWLKQIVPVFERNEVKILRIGLHPSEGLLHGDAVVAGPFHVSLKELLITERWKELLCALPVTAENIAISVPMRQLNYAIGYEKSNLKFLKLKFKNVDFIGVEDLENYNFNVYYS